MKMTQTNNLKKKTFVTTKVVTNIGIEKKKVSCEEANLQED